MDYVVSPWTIYFINLVGNFRDVLTAVLVLVLFVLIVFTMVVMAEDEFDEYKSVIKKIFFSVIGILFLMWITPTKSTLYQMLIFSHLTKNNISKVHQILTSDLKDALTVHVKIDKSKK